jgi:thymidylate synthase (FAD)
MNIITPLVQIINQNYDLDSIYKHIELCGRTCYRSQDKITEDSAKRFVDNLIKSGHGSVLEHGTVYLTIPIIPETSYRIDRYRINKYSKTKIDINKYVYRITTNLRVLVENDWIDDLKYLCEPTEYHEKRITVKFITGIDISRELNRHRVNSISEESTRYCNYSLGKFGSSINIALNTDIDEQDVIDCAETWDSCWDDNRLNEDRLFRTMCLKIGNNKDDLFGIVDTWFFANLACEWAYKRLISLGWKAQQARRILPLDTQTELVHTAFISDWKHFLSLRSPKYGATGVHPDAAYLADELYDLLQIGG